MRDQNPVDEASRPITWNVIHDMRSASDALRWYAILLFTVVVLIIFCGIFYFINVQVPLDDNGAAWSSRLIHITISRVGLALLMLFLVKIFLTLFRYIMRLQAYNASRMDALKLAIELSQVEIEQFEALCAVLNADKVELNAVPDTPAEIALKWLKELNGLQNTKARIAASGNEADSNPR